MRVSPTFDVSNFGPQNQAKIAAALADGERLPPSLLKAMIPAGTREEDIQAAILRELRSLGYLCLQTTVRVRLQSCPACQETIRPRGNTGADKAVPDLLVRDSAWPAACWLGLEIKGPKTALSAEQKALQSQSAIIVARSIAEAVMHVTEFSESVKAA